MPIEIIASHCIGLRRFFALTSSKRCTVLKDHCVAVFIALHRNKPVRCQNYVCTDLFDRSQSHSACVYPANGLRFGIDWFMTLGSIQFSHVPQNVVVILLSNALSAHRNFPRSIQFGAWIRAQRIECNVFQFDGLFFMYQTTHSTLHVARCSFWTINCRVYFFFHWKLQQPRAFGNRQSNCDQHQFFMTIDLTVMHVKNGLIHLEMMNKIFPRFIRTFSSILGHFTPSTHFTSSFRRQFHVKTVSTNFHEPPLRPTFYKSTK